jgi:hypothetical protein
MKSHEPQEEKPPKQAVSDTTPEMTRLRKEKAWAEIDRIRAMSKKSNVSSESLIREFRDGDESEK